MLSCRKHGPAIVSASRGAGRGRGPSTADAKCPTPRSLTLAQSLPVWRVTRARLPRRKACQPMPAYASLCQPMPAYACLCLPMPAHLGIVPGARTALPNTSALALLYRMLLCCSSGRSPDANQEHAHAFGGGAAGHGFICMIP
jgi:hypothetical protein